jgi:Ca2+-binding RTX toxin-like protein
MTCCPAWAATTVLAGGNGDDTLDGGAGNDRLFGDLGMDRYRFGRGYGQDEIQDAGTDEGSLIEFLPDTLPAEVLTSRASNNLILEIAGTTDRLTVVNYFLPDSRFTIRFAEGAEWSPAELTLATRIADARDQEIQGDATANSLAGGDGNDQLYGQDGNDRLRGDAGHDTLDGGSGDDSLAGGDGNDTLRGGDGDDRLDGGRGNDILEDDAGSDTYVFAAGSGQDTLKGRPFPTAWDVNEQDTLLVTGGLTAADLSFDRYINDLVIGIRNRPDSFRVEDYFSLFPSARLGIAFNDGSRLALQDILHRMGLTGDAGEVVNGDAQDNRLSGGDGDDTLNGLGGNDILTGDIGNDTLLGGDGDDILLGGWGENLLDGQAGNDRYRIEVGEDTLVFGHGSGHDRIEVDRTLLDFFPLHTVIRLKEGITVNDLGLRIDGNSISLLLQDGADSLTLTGLDDSPLGSLPRLPLNYSISLEFANGDVWTSEEFLAHINRVGLTFRDDDQAGYLTGSQGNDALYGQGGDDLIDGDRGQDWLEGGAGSDLYLFNPGDGQDTLDNRDAGIGKRDQLHFGSRLHPDDLEYRRVGDDLLLAISGSDDRVTVLGYFRDDGLSDQRLEEIGFDDGVVLTLTDIRNQVLRGNDSDQTLTGYATADRIEAGGGADTVSGMAGNDWLDGGSGNDLLDGGTGADILTGGQGDDRFVIDQTGDTVRELAGQGIDTVLSHISYTLGDQLEKLILLEGALTGTGNSLGNALTGNALGNRLDGGLGADLMAGLDGNDRYYVDHRWDQVVEAVDAGDDYVYSTVSYTLAANVERLYLLEGSTALTATGNALDNRLTGNSMGNTLDGGGGNDLLIGAAGDDTYVLRSGGGQDKLTETTGGANGNDTLQVGGRAGQIWFRHVGHDLEVSLIGTGDRMLVQGWYAGIGGVEQIRNARGEVLSAAAVENLVTAMAALTPPPAGTTGLSAEYQKTLQPVLAANWAVNNLPAILQDCRGVITLTDACHGQAFYLSREPRPQ